MAETMRAARLYGPGQPLRIEEVPVPAIGPHDALVRVRAAGVCHTELHFLSGLLNLGVFPITLGHEIAGEVVAVGEHVRHVALGERVIAYYYAGCGRCRWCRTGQENLCPQPAAELGFITDGGFAEYVRTPARSLVAIPPEMGPVEAATLGCSAATAIHAVGIARLALGETAVVYGVGAVGLALVQVAKMAGARVIAVGRTPAKLAKARELGADEVIDAGRQPVAEAVRRLTGGQGADVVFELVGTAETMPQAVESLGKRGRLVFIGYSQDAFTVHPINLVVGEITVTASVGNTLEELVRAVEMAHQGKLRPVIDRVVALEEVNGVLEELKQGKVVGRAVVRP